MRKLCIIAVASIALAIAAPAAAQDITGIWTASGDRIEAKPAKISFPRTIAGLTLNKTGEFSRKGEQLDSSAEYHSADGKLWATIYVYRPGYPDAALAAYETDAEMPLIYGAAIERTSYATAALGGRAGTAIRITYRGGVLGGHKLASGSGFSRIGGWIIKVRVSGPVEREAEVVAALDAFLAAPGIDGKAWLFPVSAPNPVADCPGKPTGGVNVVKDDKSDANAIGAAMMAVVLDDKPKKDDIPPAFPANGLTKFCRRGAITVGQSSYPVLAPAGEANPATVIVLLNDLGNVVMVGRNLLGNNYTVTASEIGKVMVGGELDRLPDNDQLVAILTGKVEGALAIRASVLTKASGDSTIGIVTPPKK